LRLVTSSKQSGGVYPGHVGLDNQIFGTAERKRINPHPVFVSLNGDKQDLQYHTNYDGGSLCPSEVRVMEVNVL
jgi:hypothetical protein